MKVLPRITAASDRSSLTRRSSANRPWIRQLTRNYRSSQTIVTAALQAIAPTTLVTERTLAAMSENFDRISFHASPTERAEAEFVVHTIERSIGGSTFFSRDSGRVDTSEVEARSFADGRKKRKSPDMQLQLF